MNLYKNFLFIISSYLLNFNFSLEQLFGQETFVFGQDAAGQVEVQAQVTGQPVQFIAQDFSVRRFVTVSTTRGVGETSMPGVITQGTVELSNSEDIFVNLAYTYPFISSSINQYITSHVSQNFILNFEPTFVQMPYLDTISNNLVNGRFTVTSLVENNLVVITYNVEYNDNQYVNIITYYNPDTNILFFELPRQISYDSADQLSFSFSEINTEEINGRMIVPESWLRNENNNNGNGRILETRILSGIPTGVSNSNNNNTNIPTIQPVASADYNSPIAEAFLTLSI
jgi:hypothetical protein